MKLQNHLDKRRFFGFFGDLAAVGILVRTRFERVMLMCLESLLVQCVWDGHQSFRILFVLKLYVYTNRLKLYTNRFVFGVYMI